MAQQSWVWQDLEGGRLSLSPSEDWAGESCACLPSAVHARPASPTPTTPATHPPPSFTSSLLVDQRVPSLFSDSPPLPASASTTSAFHVGPASPDWAPLDLPLSWERRSPSSTFSPLFSPPPAADILVLAPSGGGATAAAFPPPSSPSSFPVEGRPIDERSPSPKRLKGKRRRRRLLSDLPEEERQRQLRTAHRSVDATRRTREAALLNALRLSTANAHGPDGSGDASASKADKVSVLQRTLDEVERLQSLCRQLREASNAKDERLRRLAQHVDHLTSLCLSLVPSDSASSASVALPSLPSSLPSAVSSTAAFVDGQHRSDSLYRATLVDSGLCLCLLDVRTGTVLDISRHYCDATGWARAEVLHTSVSPVQCGLPASRMSPHHMRPPTDIELEEERTDEWYLRRFVPQYPRSVDSLKRLMAGEVRSLQGEGRIVKADGRTYEVQWMAWLGRVEHLDDGKGGLQRIPCQLVMAAAIEDALLTDLDQPNRE